MVPEPGRGPEPAAPGGPSAAHDPPIGPEEVWSAWSWDPWILGALGLAVVLYSTGLVRLWRRAGRGRGIPRWRAACYYGGLVALFVALVSPIHAAGEALFSLHMVQHLLLMTVAAPLLVLGRPMLAYLWALPEAGRWGLSRSHARHRGGLGPVRRVWGAATHPVLIFVLHVGALWSWHTPRLYEAALREPWVHDLEHASFFLTALLFWWALVRTGGPWARSRYGAAILYVFATALQSGALGALITFAPEPWYASHVARTPAWGLPPLVDQQLAGILMWVPVGLVYAGAVVALFVAWLGEAERRVGRWEGGLDADAVPTAVGGGPSSRP